MFFILSKLAIIPYVCGIVYIHFSTYMYCVLIKKTYSTTNRKLSNLASVYIYILNLVKLTINLQSNPITTFIAPTSYSTVPTIEYLASIYLSLFNSSNKANSHNPDWFGLVVCQRLWRMCGLGRIAVPTWPQGQCGVRGSGPLCGRTWRAL